MNESPTVKIETFNYFHAGWLCCILGLPIKQVDDFEDAVPIVDRQGWIEGWYMAEESRFDIVELMQKTIESGYLKINDGLSADAAAGVGGD